MALAGYAHVTQVVRRASTACAAGWWTCSRWARPCPSASTSSTTRSRASRPSTPTPSARCIPVQEIRLLPAREFPLDDKGRTRFRSRFRETFEGDPSRAAIYKDVSNGIAPAGIEYYLPLFFDDTATLLDYLPADTPVLLHRDVPAAIAEFWKDTRSRYDLLKGDRTRPVLPPEQLFLTDEAFFLGAEEPAAPDHRRRAPAARLPTRSP
jgi:transcription-repair coupling factor (superfamily II helicase)